MLDIVKLNRIKCFLLDMDGTFYLGNKLIKGSKEFLAILEKKNLQYFFLTNNSSKNRAQYASKLKTLGLNVTADHIFTSGQATAVYIKGQFPDKKIICFGTRDLQHEIRTHDLCLVDSDPDLIVLGFDTTLTYKRIWQLCDLVRSGLPFIATHSDLNCPIEDGFMPDTGSFLTLIETSTGRKPDVIIGKPHRHILDALSGITGVKSRECAMVGDRLYTDMALEKFGVFTILVLTGETSRNDLVGSKIKPNLVLESIQDLVKLIK